MLSRIRVSLGLAMLLVLLFASPVFAGGWAVITLDALPLNIIAGEPLTVGFTVLQHGRTPLDDLTPTITANLYKEKEFVVHAEPDGLPGHYTATLTFPKEGDWQWSIQAFTMDQTMPMLKVDPPTAFAGKEPVSDVMPVTLSTSLMVVVGTLAFAVALVSGVIAFRRRSRLAMTFTVLCLLAGVALSITGAGKASGVEAQAKSEVVNPADVSLSQVEFGKQLFIAKGCITCHYNSKAASPSEYLTIETGAPDLSKFSASPEVLRMRLNDPSSVKSDTNMPKMTLSDAEIKALIAFINSK